MRPVDERPIVGPVVVQHAEECALLWGLRSSLVRRRSARLEQIGRLDERLDAHLDGLTLAAQAGRRLVRRTLAKAGAGEVFTATVLAILADATSEFDDLLMIVEAEPALREGLLGALGWVSPRLLAGHVARLLDAPDAGRRALGFATCLMHRVVPGPQLERALDDDDEAVRSTSYRIAGECAETRLLPSLLARLETEPTGLADEAMRSCLLLGDRGAALDALRRRALDHDARFTTVRMALALSTREQSDALLHALSTEPAKKRLLLEAVGAAGNPSLVAWLIEHMRDERWAKVAGASFSMISGADLSALDLDARSSPGGVRNASDAVQDVDDQVRDAELSWPDPDRILDWWTMNQKRFAAGDRYLVGDRPASAHCIQVLRTGSQGEREAAAEHLVLQHPGTPLFDVAAPAWRQQRRIDRMS